MPTVNNRGRLFWGAAFGSSPGEGQLKAPQRISRSRRFPYLRLMAEQSSRPVAYPLRSSR
jgi:hypothetical protein